MKTQSRLLNIFPRTFKRTRRLRQGGDTIVEVLVCMAVISLVLAGAFVTTHNSQLGVLNSQEHAEALKLLEGQVEELRAASDTGGTPAVFTTPFPFCMYQGAPKPTSAIISAPIHYCTQDSGGNPTNAQPVYSLSIQCQGSCPDANNGWLFKLQATWPEISGNGQGSEIMLYRLYP